MTNHCRLLACFRTNHAPINLRNVPRSVLIGAVTRRVVDEVECELSQIRGSPHHLRDSVIRAQASEFRVWFILDFGWVWVWFGVRLGFVWVWGGGLEVEGELSARSVVRRMSRGFRVEG